MLDNDDTEKAMKHTIVKIRQLLEGRDDERLRQLEASVKNNLDGQTLLQLVRVAKRARKRVLVTFRSKTVYHIEVATLTKPDLSNWHAASHLDSKEVPSHTPFFLLAPLRRDNNFSGAWWISDELVHDNAVIRVEDV